VSYPLIANGRVFVTVGNANEYGTTLFALDAKTGQSLWSQSITGTYFWSAAAYDSGQVFVLSFDGLLKAFDEKTGVMNWSVQVANEYFVTSPPVAGNGVVYVEGDGSDTLTAYLETSGALIWTQGIEAGDGAPALSSEGIYTYSPCQVYAFHPISGRPLWHYAGDCDGGGGTTPVYRNNSLYISDPAGSGNQIFNAATGAITGTFDTNALPPTISRGVAYYLASGTLEAVDLSSNKVLWNFAGDGGLAQLPIEVNGKIFIGSTSGLLWVLDAFTGKQVWSTNVGAPIAPNGCCTGPNTGLAASGGIVVVPASDILVAYH
jgi:outer membrane protein assembly factor BamB